MDKNVTQQDYLCLEKKYMEKLKEKKLRSESDFRFFQSVFVVYERRDVYVMRKMLVS